MANKCKYYKEKQQVSYDFGVTWLDTGDYRKGNLYEYQSADCPVVFSGKWLATYSGGTTSSAECDSTSAITNGEVTTTDLVDVLIGDCVTSIGNRAFWLCASLTSATIGNGVTSIGSDAFYICRTLTSITIPNTVTTIGAQAFAACRSITSLTIPDSVTTIGNRAFGACSGLTSCTIGSGVTSIGDSGFTDNASIASITVNATTPPTLGSSVFDYTNNCPIYVPCESVDAYKAASGWSTYASRIQGIPPCSEPQFDGKWLATYTGGTTSSAECDSSSAISENEISLSNLQDVQIGSCVTSIGNSAFEGCSSLTSIELPNSVTWIGYSAFFGCSGLTSVDIPSGVTIIGNYTFAACSGLTSITIPSGVTRIDGYAFIFCSSLTSITIESTTPPSLGSGAFAVTNDCPIYVPCQSVDTYKSASGWSTYASRIQGIPPCGQPPTPTFSGKWLATYSGGTTSSAECDSTSAITSGEITRTDLVEVLIGDCVTSIGQQTFQGCTSLSSVIIPDSVTSIDSFAFLICSGLTSVTIGNGLTNIGASAFRRCYNLSSITIPDSVTSINSYAFNDCTSLTSCTIGSGVTSIGNQAFLNCSGLTSITINSVSPPTMQGSGAFNNTNDCPIYVPSQSVNAYKSAWSEYASRIQATP